MIPRPDSTPSGRFDFIGLRFAPRLRVIAAGLAVASLALAGCGGGSSPVSTGATGAPSTGTTPVIASPDIGPGEPSPDTARFPAEAAPTVASGDTAPASSNTVPDSGAPGRTPTAPPPVTAPTTAGGPAAAATPGGPPAAPPAGPPAPTSATPPATVPPRVTNGALPSVSVYDVAAGTKIDLATVPPADRPLLVWFWAPH